jgi:hypothetical protein
MLSPDERKPAAGPAFEEQLVTGQVSLNCSARATLSVISSDRPARLAKHFELREGALVKSPGGELERGRYQRVSVEGPRGLAALVEGLASNQALTFGVARVDQGRIAARNSAGAGDLTRTRECFDWPAGPGVLFVDYDPAPGATPLDCEAFTAALASCWPALANAPAVRHVSGSSYLFNAATGEQVKGAGGRRLWVIVADARDIPRAGKALFERAWLAGFGFYVVSKSGALLPRSLIDAAVFQPERLDFASGASCGPGVVQRRPAPEALNPDADPIDTAATLPSLDAEERQQLADLQAAARAATAGAQERARTVWVADRMTAWERNGAKPGDPDAAATRETMRAQFERAAAQHRLFGDFELIHSSGRTVTVGTLLDDPKRWHGERFADPLEPDYGNDRRIALVNLRSGGRPYIYSHAHGGQRFTLERPSATIQVCRGDGPRIVEQADALLRLTGEVFQRGGQLVRVADGGILSVSGPWLRNHLETVATFTYLDGRSKEWRPTDCPGELHARLLHNRGSWSVCNLTGIVRAPILRPDGSLLDRPGFDEITGLLLLADTPDEWPAIPERPTRAAITEAIRTLWEPFEHFPFVTPVDRAVHLAACLTAVQRPVLETAPGFAWNAYRPGTGKSKAAKAVAWLGGSAVPESPWSSEPEEQRKRLMSSLLAGPQALLLDNINGQLDSDTLCAILTSSQFSDRRLGVSEEVTVPTRVLILATGNNLQVVGDLARRVLPATIDHGIEAPERLPFPFCPVERMKERWIQCRAAALTVLRGFCAAGWPASGLGAMGSYEAWDRLIRQCVIWLGANGLAPFTLGDPADAVRLSYAADPETMKLRALLAEWRNRFGIEAMSVAGVTRAAIGELFDVLDEIAGERGVLNKRRLGRWIERHQGRVADGKRLVRSGERQGVALWSVRDAT